MFYLLTYVQLQQARDTLTSAFNSPVTLTTALAICPTIFTTATTISSSLVSAAYNSYVVHFHRAQPVASWPLLSWPLIRLPIIVTSFHRAQPCCQLASTQLASNQTSYNSYVRPLCQQLTKGGTLSPSSTTCPPPQWAEMQF